MKAPVIEQDVLDFHHSQILIDMHVDVIIQHRLFRYNIRKRHKPWMRRQPFIWHADIPRMLEGGYTSAILGIHYYPWESKRAWKEVRKQLSYMEKVVAEDERVLLARNASDILRAKENGQLAFMAGLEGAHLLNGDLERLDEAVERGCIYLTLAHFSRNAAAVPGMGRGSGSTDGLSEFGRKLVRRMNDLKIIVDVAHVNPAGVLDACSETSAPVIASHTCCISMHENTRGMTDEGIRAVAETGGVIGVIFSPGFLKGKFDVSLDAVVEQTMYIADMVGPEHLAVGSDFDGWIPSIPNDIRDCRDMPLLTQKLLAAGMSKDEVSGVLGRNLLRVIETIRS